VGVDGLALGGDATDDDGGLVLVVLI